MFVHTLAEPRNAMCPSSDHCTAQAQDDVIECAALSLNLAALNLSISVLCGYSECRL